ncbi:MAG: hypothetical protein JWP22_3892 [Ramlibacter sp.]|jgi:hypothetical protein|nr:hypothetical protein [Ramlibacter sp.]
MPEPTDQAARRELPAADPGAPAADDDPVESRPGQGENQAGFLKDTEQPGGGSERS